MRKNQKYTKEEMFLAMELWQESGISQKKFCTRENIPFYIFKYWHKKYKEESATLPSQVTKSFIPVQVTTQPVIQPDDVSALAINITYPSGIQVSCPINIAPQQLRALINL